jgi:stage II sporulation protein D
MRRRALLAAALSLGIAVACAAAGSGSSPTPSASREWQQRIIRVALATSADSAVVSAQGSWRLFGDDGRSLLRRSSRDETWVIESSRGRLRAIRNGIATPWSSSAVVVSADDESVPVVYAGRPYRGELWISPSDSGLRVINRVFVEDYLRSVVPAEIGHRTAAERAAVEAQAIAARSYAYVRLGETADIEGYDVVSSVGDQVYRGVTTEREVSDAAVRSTAGLVLYYNGRPVSAPYSSTCGGMTAAASELWRSNDEPYLKRVSDRIPGTDRHFCDPSPRFRWTRTLDGETLDRAMAAYLRRYARVGSGPVGATRDVRIDDRTESGRAAAIMVTTSAGEFRVRGNDARYVLRPPNGEILNSTYFSLSARSEGGRIRTLTITGTGYGHGVGMCQWGAIGRARAGQDYREILGAYYPGTTIGPAR